MRTAHDVILAPIISEASMDRIEHKKYTFRVVSDATKPEIASAIESIFGVSVQTVHTVNVKRKPKRLGAHSGYTSEWKKAIVTLTADSKTIEFFDGMR